MAAVGGSIESVDLSGRIFAVAADAEVQRKIGGVENEALPNGNGTSRLIQKRVLHSLDGLVLDCDDSRGDHEYIQELANSKDFFPVSITYASGAVYQGRSQIVGEIQYNNQSATATVNLMGPGELTKQ